MEVPQYTSPRLDLDKHKDMLITAARALNAPLSHEERLVHLTSLAEIYYVAEIYRRDLYNHRPLSAKTIEEFSARIATILEDQILTRSVAGKDKVGIPLESIREEDINGGMQDLANKLGFATEVTIAIDDILPVHLEPYYQGPEGLVQAVIKHEFGPEDLMNELEKLKRIYEVFKLYLEDSDHNEIKSLSMMSVMFRICNLYTNASLECKKMNEEYYGFWMAYTDFCYHFMYRFSLALQDENPDEMIPLFYEITYFESLLSGGHNVQ